VAQLGDFPTVQRYEELAALRNDLPSVGTVRNRLGRWSAIAVELVSELQAPNND
jgi:hypothetical protein